MQNIQTHERAAQFVDRFAESDSRWEAYVALDALGADALPAIRQGLSDGRWQVRRWCAIYLDHHADTASLELLVPLLHDPKSQVRMWAVHSLACDRCKEGENPIDVVPLLIQRIENDDSIRVRRMATIMLASGGPDPRAVKVFESLLEQESDRKLLLHAGNGLQQCRDAGL